MEQIAIKGVDKDIYKEILPNGLKLILIPNDKKTKKKNYYINYGVHYGALNNEFVPLHKNKMKTYPAGIAHFLEHKLFEMEDGTNPFSFYSESGTYVNAYTSYKATSFVLSGSKKLEENLSYLFKVVHSPYFTDENVSKEQGIIAEEIHMRHDDPDYLVYQMLNRNLYHKLPYNLSVLGTTDSIAKITKEYLYECYRTFYRPSNMFLVIAGCFDKEKVYQLVTSEMAKLKDLPTDKIVCKSYKEPLTVCKEYEEDYAKTKVEKLAIGYKMKRSSFKVKNDLLLRLYLNMLVSLNFGSSSIFHEKSLEEHLVVRSGYSFQDAYDNYGFIVEADTMQSDKFIEALEEQLANLSVQEEDLERMKKVWISSEVIKSDYANALLDSFVDDLVCYQDIFVDYVDMIRSMNIETMNSIIHSLDFSNRSIAKIIPQE